MSSNHQFVSLSVSDGTSMQAYTAVPSGKDKVPFPAIIIFQEAFGVNHHTRNLVERFAEQGYVAIAPELFHRTAPPGFEGSYTDFSIVASHFQAITAQTIEADARAVWDWLHQHPQVQKEKIACIGHCLGGRASFITNAALPLKAAVSYYGGSTDQLLDKATQQHAPILFFWGGLDKHITPEKREAVISEMTKQNKPFVNVLFSYADHAFFNDERPNYHPQAAKESWALTLAFLKEKLEL